MKYLILTMLISGYALADPNDYIKDCMVTTNWQGDYSKLSSCTSNHLATQQKQREEELRKFLAKHPWYRGPNWRWELKTEYTCSNNGSITLCTKPYYLN